MYALLSCLLAALLCGAASAQPVASKLGHAVAVAPVVVDDEDSVDWVLVSGSGGYLAGAVGGVALSYLLVPADSLRNHVPLRVAAGVAGGTLASVGAVYVANGLRGNLLKMTGGALAGQALGLGAAASFVLLDVVVHTIFDAREPGFSWIGMGLVLGTPFYATLGADFASGAAP